MVEGIIVEEVNLGKCHRKVFTFISKSKNTKKLLLYNIADDSGEDSDIVKGMTSALPKLAKLRLLDIRDVYLKKYGKSLLHKIKSPDLRILMLSGTHLGGNERAEVGQIVMPPLMALLSCL